MRSATVLSCCPANGRYGLTATREVDEKRGRPLRTLIDEYRAHDGKVSDKWTSYFAFYDEIFAPYRDCPVRVFEIGIQNGGSLEIWSKYFPNAELIVGCDINEACSALRYDDPRIRIITGDANDPGVLAKVVSLGAPFDIIIDDGSHRSSDIVKSFSLYFSNLKSGGIYVAEDLHCSYWDDYQGGVDDATSSVNFFKRLVDYVNAEHWGISIGAEQLLSQFSEQWEITFSPDDLCAIQEVRFRNSIAAVFKTASGANTLGKRFVAGKTGIVSPQALEAHGTLLSVPAQKRPHNVIGHSEELALRRELARVQGAYRQSTARAEHFQTKLTDARTHPLKQLGRNLTYATLTALSRTLRFVSPAVAERYARSAHRRDPKNIESSTRRKETPSGVAYAKVLAAWEAQRATQKEQIARIADELRDGPLISVIVPVHNTEPMLLDAMIASVRRQSYRNWELCIADDCSPFENVREILKKYAAEDSRIRVVYRETNGHISEATNSALGIASGAFFAFLKHDDLLDRDALLLVANALRENADARIVYTDEDTIALDGLRSNPHFKPDWNRLLLLETNYICHFAIFDAALVRKVGGLRKGFEGAQDHDLLLRCSEFIEDYQVVHVPKVLYSRRASSESGAVSPEAKFNASEAGRRAVAEHLKRTTGEDIEVASGPLPLTYMPRWKVTGTPLVSIIMPTRDRLDMLQAAVLSVLNDTDYKHFELIIVDNGSREPKTSKWLDKIVTLDSRVRVLRDDQAFNYSKLNNQGAEASKGEYLLLLNNDVEVISSTWLEEMLALAQRERAGCIGAKLYYPNDTIQHAGAIIGTDGQVFHSHSRFPGTHRGYFGRLRLRQELTAVTAACLLIRRSLFLEVGGLNETDLPITFNDIDFCLKVQAKGYRNAWTPYAELYHHESISRGHDTTPEKRARAQKELECMQKAWSLASFRDPAYNPNLFRHGNFSIGPPVWKI